MPRKRAQLVVVSILFALAAAGCNKTPTESASVTADPAIRYDIVIRNGQVFDGSGAAPQDLDVAIKGERIAALLPRGAQVETYREIDAKGRAVTPGFINVLSWAVDSLIADGRGLSDTRQGVTTEIFGEGWSMGPYNEAMKLDAVKQQGDIKYEIEWTSLGEYLDFLQARGITPNVASFVGATTVRINVLGEDDVDPDEEQLRQMQGIVREAMSEGALGVGASLIYPPAFFAETPELIALASAAAETGGGYVAHMRSEANQLPQAMEETIAIARATGQHTEAYHLKAAGEENWPKMAEVIDQINSARAEGVDIAANMYAYTAGATGLTAALPPWVQAGGHEAMIARLKDPTVRKKLIEEMRTPSDNWENLRLLAGDDSRVLFIGFRSEALKPLIGKTLAEVSESRGTAVEDTIIDLIIEDDSRVDTAYFLMSEENVELGLSQPWTTLGSDAESSAPEGVFLKSSTHPRAYGNFARFLGHYVRDRKLMTLEEGIHRLTGMPAANWKLRDRGCLAVGCFADIVIFDPALIADHSTYEKPMQLATGIDDVFVNGVQVLDFGTHTGAKPGQVIRGPGWSGLEKEQ
ncbi:N-acyl-D-amino-acid deacylase family protein [Dokdonella sp.]|uniref:N-acyl-D-amino-acid deacylase family protein n=1 Tax=Dokdonella sp. TaxID=2291710 RepID=UPI003C5B8085